MDRITAEDLGRRLDKMEKDHYKNHKFHIDYYELIQTANSMGEKI